MFSTCISKHISTLRTRRARGENARCVEIIRFFFFRVLSRPGVRRSRRFVSFSIYVYSCNFAAESRARSHRTRSFTVAIIDNHRKRFVSNRYFSARLFLFRFAISRRLRVASSTHGRARSRRDTDHTVRDP